jgi:hypothetical protein
MTTLASARTRYADAVSELAVRVLNSLRGTQDADLLPRFVRDAPDRAAALAAVRVLGADTLAGHRLAGENPPHPAMEVIHRAVQIFPRDPGVDEETHTYLAWQDWALDQTAAPPMPRPGAEQAWKSWSVWLTPLSVLAMPGLDSAVHRMVRANPLAVVRGATRSVLRRDYPSAAALARWVALLAVDGVAVPLDAGLLAAHVRLLGGADTRTALDIAIAERMLQGVGE